MRVGLLSDAHGNIEGLELGLQILRTEQVDEIWFLGDAIGYIPDVAVLRRLREDNIQALLGNHEALLLSARVSEEQDRICQLEQTRRLLKEDDIRYMEELLDHARMMWGDQEVLLVHGSPNDYVYGYVYPDTSLEMFSGDPAEIICMGNTHHPFQRTNGRQTFVNVGSCGLPRDDSGMGCVVVYDSASKSFRHLHFALAESARSILDSYKVHKSVVEKLQYMIAEAEDDR